MLIHWSDSADDDLEKMLDYFREIGSEEVGREIVSNLFDSTDKLITYPLSGRIGRYFNTRELVSTSLPYVIVYRLVSPDIVRIMRVIHTSRLFPEFLSTSYE